MRSFTLLAASLAMLLPLSQSTEQPPVAEDSQASDILPPVRDLSFDSDTAIVGGTLASVGEFPSIVQGSGCAGTLVAEDVVLTAAHCDGNFGSTVIVGNTVKGQANGQAQVRRVLSGMYTQGFNSRTYENDFMLFKIERVTNALLTPVAFNTDASNPANNDPLTVIGFGRLSYQGSQSNYLRKVTVNSISTSQCNSMYGPGRINGDVMMCAGVTGGGKDSCQGDSGGPIFDQSGKQVGIVSWGIGCAQANYPGVYSRISGKKDFIRETICRLTDTNPSFCSNGGDVPSQPEPEPPQQNPTGDISYAIEVHYDDRPWETRIAVLSAGRSIADMPRNSALGPGAIVRSEIALVPGEQYQITLRDSGWDGMTAGASPGFVTILAIQDGVETVVRRVGGRFQWKREVTFTVPDF